MHRTSYPVASSSTTPLARPILRLCLGLPLELEATVYTMAQLLSDRGYAVLQPNYRASVGFGKRWLNLGNCEWGVGTMQHDLTDCVEWAVAEGVADRDRVAIMGGSYGGYTTLAGLAFTPDLYACGVDIVGPSHIKTLFESIPPYWAPMKKMLVLRVGDVEGDDAVNRQISPVFHASAITKPLLIGQGASDPWVKQAESDQIAEAIRSGGRECEYAFYSDKGHGFTRPQNKLDFYGREEIFLAKHLGGCAAHLKPVKGSSYVKK